jgi:hypothetical protein
MKSMDYETLKRVQGDMLGVLGQPRCPHFLSFLIRAIVKWKGHWIRKMIFISSSTRWIILY